ncbi:MAG TPA: hypothetical protein VKV40_02620 [Ktedonobacteraceae bacterium]|nr:hypothetical protein [Ktedonobacteraceae bacterium]
MVPQVSDSPEQKQEHEEQQPVAQPLPTRQTRLSRAGIISLLALIGMLLITITGMLIRNPEQLMPQAQLPTPTSVPASPTATHAPIPTATPQPDVSPTPVPPLLTANGQSVSSLQLSMGHFVLYEQQNNIYMVSSSGGLPQAISTPGYLYNQAVRPILTPKGQLLYAGNGIWITDVFDGKSRQIATIGADQVVTSLALSSDGSTVAYTVEPANGRGNIDLYAGPLSSPALVYQQTTANCPCFRVFSFLYGQGQRGDTTLLLADSQNSQNGVQYGLWSMDLTQAPVDTPTQLMSEDDLEGPLLMAPYSNVLLYSSNEGTVPVPTDETIPADIASLTYANSLDLANIGGNPLTVSSSQVVLPEQRNLSNPADYRWETTPVFSPDGHTLVYVEFSSEPQAPFDRVSAIYEAQVSGTGSQLHVSAPQLLATSSASLLELGPWFNDHILTFYADGTLYAMDPQTMAVTTIIQTNAYARIIAVVGLNQI